MRFFVTGATGFIGSELVRQLTGAGHEVVVFHRPGSDLSPLEGRPAACHAGDLLEVEEVARAMEGCDGVFHVAGNTSWYRKDRRLITRLHVHGARTVLEAMNLAGVGRAVQTSTVSAVGLTDDPDRPATEETPHNWPTSFYYPHSKRQAESVFLAATELETIAVNPGTVMGPGDRRMGVGELFKQVQARKVPRLKRGGLSTCDVRDVARGHLLAFEQGTPGERYLLVGENVPYVELVSRIASELGVEPPGFGVGPFLVKVIYLMTAFQERLGLRPQTPASQVWCMSRYVFHSNEKARNELGYTSRPLAETLADSVRWYRQAGLLGG